jgi:glycosyltransferase involved in cell wall biosynthesis
MTSFRKAGAPRVTVVTPAYNVAAYIGEAVDSVVRQTFTDFEYLVVDDGSADNSAEVARAHAGDDPRFRLVPGEHRGLSAARNAGIREGKGEYIAYLDGDDRWHPRFLERQIALMESLPPDVGLVFCRSRMILENGTPVFFQWQRAGRYDFDDFLVGSNPARNGSSLLIRRSCFTDVGGFNEELHSVEDLDMWLRIADGSKTPVLWGSKPGGLAAAARFGHAKSDGQ